VFYLLEKPSPSRRIFIGSNSLALSGRQLSPSRGIRAGYESFGTLTSLGFKDGISGTGIGSSALRWEKLLDVAEADGCVPPIPGKGQILWDVTVNTSYVHLINFLAPGSKDMNDTNNKAV
jgi:hypothetical protein